MGFLAVLKALFRYASDFPWFVAAILSTVLFDAAFETALPLVLAWLVDEAIVPGRPDLFWFPVGLLAGGWLASALVQVARDYVLAQLAALVTTNLRQNLADAVSQRPFGSLRSIKAARWQELHGPDLQQIEALFFNVVPLLLFGLAYLYPRRLHSYLDRLSSSVVCSFT